MLLILPQATNSTKYQPKREIFARFTFRTDKMISASSSTLGKTISSTPSSSHSSTKGCSEGSSEDWEKHFDIDHSYLYILRCCFCEMWSILDYPVWESSTPLLSGTGSTSPDFGTSKTLRMRKESSTEPKEIVLSPGTSLTSMTLSDYLELATINSKFFTNNTYRTTILLSRHKT